MTTSDQPRTPRTPRRKPPWWPEDEAWPPAQWGGPWHRHGPGRGSGWPGRRRPFGCALFVFVLLLAGTLTAAVWALAALVGLVNAPPVVLAGGLVATALVALAAFAAWRGVRRMSAPIDDLVAAAERIERGDYSTRVEERGPAQMRSLARAFNQMSARLSAVDTSRRTFLADAAHELRTPLTIIKGQLEAIEDGIYPADSEHLVPINDQLRALEQMVDDIRTVALAEAGALTLDLEPTDLREVVDDVLDAFRPQASGDGIELVSDVGSDVPAATVDEQRVRQVLVNLVANSMRHCGRGDQVSVAVGRAAEPAWLEVVVADTGSGVPPELQDSVFGRFVKGPASSGSGLGLAICRDVVEAHGGRIGLDSTVGKGTKVTFTLPSVDSPR